MLFKKEMLYAKITYNLRKYELQHSKAKTKASKVSTIYDEGSQSFGSY